MNDNDKATALEKYRRTLVEYRHLCRRTLNTGKGETGRLVAILANVSYDAGIPSKQVRDDIEQAWADASAARLRRIRSR